MEKHSDDALQFEHSLPEEDISTESQSSPGSKNMSTLKLMMDAHFGDPYANINANYQCAGCTKVFNGFKNYKTHFDTSHPQILNVCKTCYVVFTNENTLREHVLELSLLCSVKIVHQGDEIEASNTHTPPPNLVVAANEVIETHQVETSEEMEISSQSNYDDTRSVEFDFVNFETRPHVSKEPKVVVVHTLGNTQFYVKKKVDPLTGRSNEEKQDNNIVLDPLLQENEAKDSSSGSFYTNAIFPIELTGELADECAEENVVVISGINEESSVDQRDTEEDVKMAEVTIRHLIPASPTYNTRSQMKPFKCKSCLASFSSRRSLGCHKRLHSGIFYACDKCDQKFKRSEAFESHKRSHLLGNKSFSCATCGSSFTRRQTLNEHKKVKHGIHYDCDKCKRSFPAEELLARHVEQQHGDNPQTQPPTTSKTYDCSMCLMNFPSIYRMKMHVKDVHLKERPFACPKCDKKFHLNKNMLKHQLTHDVVRNPSKLCEICNKRFSLASYNSHYIRNHVHDAPKCPYCRKAFESVELRDEHVKSHSKDLIDKKKHACPICDFLFCSEGFLLIHMRKVHPDQQNYACTLCDKKFQTPTQFELHKRNHANWNHSCLHCDMFFKNITTLRRHVTTKHTTNDSKPCPLCVSVFSNIDDFNVHYQKEHETKICRKCRQIFDEVEQLIAHCKEMHSKFICPICNKSFNSNEVRDKHLKAHQYQQFVCDYCKTGYTMKVSLMKHIMIKHFPNSVQCKLCCKIFTTNEEHETHMAHHENDARTFFISKIQSFACNVCGDEFETQELFTEHEKKHLRQRK